MTRPNPSRLTRHWKVAATGSLLLALTACSALRPTTTPPPTFYALDAPPAATVAIAAAGATAPTLLVLAPRAAAGFDSQRIIYLRQDHQVEYFAHSEWVDTPARMLGALLVPALQAGGAFRAVVPVSGAATGDLRLDTEILRLQHEFKRLPSQVRFTLRATLVDDRTRTVLAWREFDTVVPSASEDPYGGVVAANRAVQATLQELSAFSTEALRQWIATPAKPALSVKPRSTPP